MSDWKDRLCPRIIVTALLISAMLTFLIGRLFFIQVVEGKNYARRAAGQRMLHLPLEISRGQIYDRNMISITGRKVVDSLVIFPSLITNKEEAARLIARATGDAYRQVLDRLDREESPFKIEGISFPEKIKGRNLRGVVLIRDVLRYDENSLARHLVGYVDQSDRIGRAGIEKLYHYYLAGEQEISVAALVDGNLRIIPGLGYKVVNRNIDIQRYNVQLTIDYHIQRKVEEVLDRYKKDGAVVVLGVDTGEVLAMASRPNYRQDRVGDYLDGCRGELLNKAIQQYNLGSIFKTVVASVVLEKNLVNPFERINCPGYARVGELEFKCSAFEQGGHGQLDIYGAYARSCNAFFIEMGKRAGGTAIIEMARAFGYGSIIGINPYEEQPGILPDIKEIYPSDIGNISIGQGGILVTPLQVADMTNTIANNGIRKKPYVVKALIDDKGNIVRSENRKDGERIISPFVAMEIRKMMERVVDEGTGKKAALPEWGGTSGKTSSAQTGQKLGENEVVHAWFTGYVPRIEPKYVITVLVENGKSGGEVAAPIFRDIAREIMELGER